MLASVAALGAAPGCQSAPAPKPTPPPAPSWTGFAVVERSAGARYVIDRRGHVCMLVVDHAITTPVDCAALAANLREAAVYITWLAKPRPTPTLPLPRARGKRALWLTMMKAGIRKLGPNRYEVERAVVTMFLRYPARGARIVPSVRLGKPNGIKLHAIRPSSFYAKIGLRNGDTIHAINGHLLQPSPDKALELYTKLRGQSAFKLQLVRRGAPIVLDITIVDDGGKLPPTKFRRVN